MTLKKKLLLAGAVFTVILLMTGFYWSYARSEVMRDRVKDNLDRYMLVNFAKIERAKRFHFGSRGLYNFMAAKTDGDDIVMGTFDGEPVFIWVPEERADDYVVETTKHLMRLQGPYQAEDSKGMMVTSYLSPESYARDKELAENASLRLKRHIGFFLIYVFPVGLALIGLCMGVIFLIGKRRLRKSAAVATLLLGFVGCVHGPETEKKSALNYLNGNHYEGTNTVSGVPVTIERKQVSTKIRGQLVLEAAPMPVPLRNQPLRLVRKTQTILETISDANGDFVFSGEIPNGIYTVRVASPRYQGHVDVDVNGYELSDIVLTAHEK